MKTVTREQKTKELAERRRQVLALADGEMTYAEIAEAVGATRSSVEKDISALRAAGLVPQISREPRHKTSPAVVAKIRRMYDAGKSQSVIASACGVSEYTVRKYGGRVKPATPAPVREYVTIASDVVIYADGGRTTVSHGISAESARRMALAMSRGREVVSHEVVE